LPGSRRRSCSVAPPGGPPDRPWPEYRLSRCPAADN